MNSSFLIILPFFIFLAGCSSKSVNVDFNLPVLRMDTPETTGESLRPKVKFGGRSSHKISLARSDQDAIAFSNSVSDVVVQDNTDLSSSFQFGFNASLGLWDRIDISIEKYNESTLEPQLKIQLWGDPGEEEKGLKIAIAGSKGYKKDEEAATKDIFSFDTTDDEKFDNVSATTAVRTEYGWIMIGHRKDESLLTYATLSYGTIEVESNIKVSDGNPINLDSYGFQRAASLGFKYTFKHQKISPFLIFEMGASQLKLSGQEKPYTQAGFGLSGGVIF